MSEKKQPTITLNRAQRRALLKPWKVRKARREATRLVVGRKLAPQEEPTEPEESAS